MLELTTKSFAQGLAMSHLFSRLLRRLRSTNQSRPPSRRPRPSVELLEDRLTPTVFFTPQLGAESPVPGHNGPTLSNTPITLIFEGSYWQNPTGITEGDAIQSVNNILNSSYLSYATQYGTNGQAYLGGIDQDKSLPLSSGAFTEAALQTLAGSYVKEGLDVPSARGIYFVITAPGVTDATREVNGYHDELTHYIPGLLGFSEEVPFGRVDNIMATRQDQIDHFSQTFGHELVESMTDPYIRTQDANRFYPGANFQTNETYDEIGDFEPNGGRYTYRLGNGTLVQAYWSQKDQKFVVPDGTAQTFTLTPRYATPPEGHITQNDFQDDFNLTANGDQPPVTNDMFAVQGVTGVTPGARAGLRVTLNGGAVNFDAGQIVDVTLNTLTGNDAVDVESLPALVNLTVNLGAGHDAVTLGQVGGQLDGLAGNVTINGGGANSTLTANDAGTESFNVGSFASLHSVAWYVTGNSLSRSDRVQVNNLGQSTFQTYLSNVTYSDLGQIDLSGGHCSDNYFLATDALGTPVTFHGTGANNQLSFYDSANDSADTVYTLTAGQVTRTGIDVTREPSGIFFYHPFTTTVQYDNVPVINVSGGPTGNVVDVNSIGGGTDVTLIAGTGVNTINVGSAASSLDAIQGGLYVSSAGTDTLVLNDTAVRNHVGSVNAVAFTVSSNSVVRTNTVVVRPIPETFSTVAGYSFSYTNTAKITYTQPHSLVIEGGPTGNTFTVQSTGANTPTTIDAGAGNDVVNVLGTSASGPLTVDGAGGSELVRVGSVSANAGDTGPKGGTLANVKGAVTVLNSAGTATLVIDDSSDPAAYSLVSVASGSLTGLGGAAAINWSGASTLLYLGGTAGQPGNMVSVDASASGGLPAIFTGPGNDTVNVLKPSVNNTLTVHGEGGNDTVNLIDPNATNASYAFDGSTLTRTGHNPDGTVSGVFTLLVDGIANVQVNSVAI